MGSKVPLLELILLGRCDNNIRFIDLVNLLLAMGFQERIKGSHHIFTKEGIVERITLQADGAHAKGYQIRQVRQIFLKYPELNNG